MLHDSPPWRRWVLLIAAQWYWCVKAQIPMSDWRTGIATNYGGVQDGRVSAPLRSLWRHWQLAAARRDCRCYRILCLDMHWAMEHGMPPESTLYCVLSP